MIEPDSKVFSVNSVDITFAEFALSIIRMREIPLKVLFSNVDPLIVILDLIKDPADTLV